MTEPRPAPQRLSTPSGGRHRAPSPGCHTDGHLRRENTDPMATQRFLTLDDVAEILNVSWSQAYALVRRKELIAIQIGGRGQWRVEKDELERFIQQKYAEARATVVTDDAVADDAEVDSPS